MKAPRSRNGYLFLYGSLLGATPNRRLNRLLQRPLRRARRAAIRARLYLLGAYPGAAAPTARRDRVYGRLLKITHPRLLRLLDRYEDCRGDGTGEFVRTAVSAQLLPSHKPVPCWVYLYNRRLAGKPRLAGGDYAAYRARRQGRR